MGATEEIINMAKVNNGVVTTAMVVAAGFSRGNIKYLEDKGLIVKSVRGVYILPEVWDDEMFNLQSRFKRGIYSHETALFLWDLTDRTMQLKAIIKNLAMEALRDALEATAKKRGSAEVIKEYRKIMNAVRNSDIMIRQWEKYRKDFEYAEGIAFEETCDMAKKRNSISVVERNCRSAIFFKKEHYEYYFKVN